MKHWSDDDYVQWIYGLKTDAGHLQECSECRERSERVAQRRRIAAQPPDVAWDFLAEQRRSIYRRLGSPLRDWVPVRWAASLATLLMVVVLSFQIIQDRRANAPLTNPGDEKLFSDLVSIEQSNEPRVVTPIHSLFEQ